jgi:hypothetical protein
MPDAILVLNAGSSIKFSLPVQGNWSSISAARSKPYTRRRTSSRWIARYAGRREILGRGVAWSRGADLSFLRAGLAEIA